MEESPIASVWVRFPLLLLDLCVQSYLKAIAHPFEKLLAADLRNIHPSFARICIEIDLYAPKENVVWFCIGDEGLWQRIEYERCPSYCKHCRI